MADMSELIGNEKLPEEAVINLIKIKFDNTNALPCKAVGYAYLLDSLDNVLYQRENVTIEAGATDANGLVTKPTSSKFSLDFTGDQIESIMNMKKVLVEYRIQAENHPNAPLNFRLSDSLTSRVSVFAQGGIDTSKSNK
jgi:hypothetical protein